MKRNYPAGYFLLFVLTNFVFHFFWLFLPGAVLCIVGIWKPVCLRIGAAVLLLDLCLSVVDQLRLTRAAVSHSENADFNELMDAFCDGGLEAFGKVVEQKIEAAPPVMSEENDP